MNVDDIANGLKSKLDTFVVVPDEEWEFCKSFMQVGEIRKGEFLTRPGDPANFFAYIHSGLVKRYFTTHDGNEIIATFDAETRVVSDFPALMQNRPANLFIEAIEDCTMLISEMGLLQKLLDRSPIWQTVLLKMTQMRYIEESNRVRELLSLNAKVLYLKFCEKYADLQKRIPQKDVARFLGVTPTSLNRIIRQIQDGENSD